MMQLTIQMLLNHRWVDAATLTLADPSLGASSPARLGYELNYAVEWMGAVDHHACSLTLPVELMLEYQSPHWFRFLDDIIPSGAARGYWLRYLGLQNAPVALQDVTLLEKGTIAPVGNLRIKEAVPYRVDGSTLHLRRFAEQLVIERDTDFLEYAQQMGAISGGATGAGGEAPKLLLRRSQDQEVWIDTYQDDFASPDDYYLVKFPRGKKNQVDCDILRTEYHYYHELTDMGINTIDVGKMMLHEGERYPSLWLPRFDVQRAQGSWQRFGLESIYSVLNRPPGSFLNGFDVLEQLCGILSKTQTEFDQEAFVCEWLKRDLLNIAFGNSDNHGRNSALLKKPGGISLAPVYDFAPMKADPEGVIRTTTWGSPFEEGGEYCWYDIAQHLERLCPAQMLLATLTECAQSLVGLKQRLEKRGVPEPILNLPTMGFDYLEQKLARWSLL